MTQAQIREEMEKMGIKFREDDLPYPEDDQVDKVTALYKLNFEFIKSLVREGHLQFTPHTGTRPFDVSREDWMRDWLNEAIEEFLFG